MKKIVILFFILVGCSTNTEKKVYIEKFDIYEELSFNEFKLKLINYAKKNDFPDIKN